MALVKNFDKNAIEHTSVHGEVNATYTVFQIDGVQYLQLDTYGSAERQIPGKKSQSIQLGPEGISALKRIIASMP